MMPSLCTKLRLWVVAVALSAAASDAFALGGGWTGANFDVDFDGISDVAFQDAKSKQAFVGLSQDDYIPIPVVAPGFDPTKYELLCCGNVLFGGTMIWRNVKSGEVVGWLIGTGFITSTAGTSAAPPFEEGLRVLPIGLGTRKSSEWDLVCCETVAFLEFSSEGEFVPAVQMIWRHRSTGRLEAWVWSPGLRALVIEVGGGSPEAFFLLTLLPNNDLFVVNLPTLSKGWRFLTCCKLDFGIPASFFLLQNGTTGQMAGWTMYLSLEGLLITGQILIIESFPVELLFEGEQQVVGRGWQAVCCSENGILWWNAKRTRFVYWQFGGSGFGLSLYEFDVTEDILNEEALLALEDAGIDLKSAVIGCLDIAEPIEELSQVSAVEPPLGSPHALFIYSDHADAAVVLFLIFDSLPTTTEADTYAPFEEFFRPNGKKSFPLLCPHRHNVADNVIKVPVPEVK